MEANTMSRKSFSYPVAALLSVLVLSGCQEIFDGSDVLLSNYSLQQGDFQKSALGYLKVLETGRHQDWVLYNLGNVYYALGESGAALEAWEGISPTTYEEIQFRLAFNRGHLHYQKGLYQEAYLQFKKALKIRPRSLVTKQNLELTLQKIQVLSAAPTQARERLPASPAAGSGVTMLEYVKQIEGSRWKSNRNVTPPAESRDW